MKRAKITAVLWVEARELHDPSLANTQLDAIEAALASELAGTPFDVANEGRGSAWRVRAVIVKPAPPKEKETHELRRKAPAVVASHAGARIQR